MDNIKAPLVVPFEEWMKLWTEEDIRELRENFEGTFGCPSCNGEGKITLEHFYTKHQHTVVDEYTVDCDCCMGSGDMDSSEVDSEQLLRDEYDNRLAIETEKYYTYMRDLKKTNKT